MRKICLLSLGVIGSLIIPLASAQAAPFLATFRTTTASETITLPLVNIHAYNFDVDWGDGTPVDTITFYNQAERVHTYVTPGDHQISVTGSMPYWNFSGIYDGNGASVDNIISIDDDGDVGFGTGVTNFASMFVNCINLQSVALFDTSSGTDFSSMFNGASSIVTIPTFVTSSGTNFQGMFFRASSFAAMPLLDISSGTNFQLMFGQATSLITIPLLITSSGTDFSRMFEAATSLTTIPLINTSSGTNFASMFAGASSLTDTPLLNTGAGTNFGGMFSQTTSLTAIPTLNTSSGTDFSAMFYEATSLTTIPLINTSAGTDFSSMFSGASSLTDIPLLNTASGTNFSAMFNQATSLITIPALNTTSGQAFSHMFSSATSLTAIPDLDVSSAQEGGLYGIFTGATSLAEATLLGTKYNISYLGTQIDITEIRSIFANLGTADPYQSIEITNTPGVSNLLPADYAVAYAKGWQVTPTQPGAPTCSDGIQNQNEEGVDCGPSCSTCIVPATGCLSFSSPYLDSVFYYENSFISGLASALRGYFYFDCDNKTFRYGNEQSEFSDAPSVVGRRGTIVELGLINTNQTAEENKTYFDTENHQFQMGQSDGTLGNMPSTGRILDATAIAALSTAEEGYLYFNTTTNEFTIGNDEGTVETFFVVQEASSCSDGQLNTGETDIDCGGVCGATCTTGDSCSAGTDCVSGSCVKGSCGK